MEFLKNIVQLFCGETGVFFAAVTVSHFLSLLVTLGKKKSKNHRQTCMYQDCRNTLKLKPVPQFEKGGYLSLSVVTLRHFDQCPTLLFKEPKKNI